MTVPLTPRAGAARALFAACLLAGSALLTGCVSPMYLDTATKEVPVADMKKVANPKPVQLNFEFLTRGAPAAAVTNFLKDAVTTQVAESGLFAPAGSGTPAGILMISLNNVKIGDDPTGKAFVTGMTFGLAGTAVTDGYECTVSYLPAGQGKPIVKMARHAIHVTIGNASPPATAGKPMEHELAIKTMTHEVLSNALRDLSLDPAFNP
ncbi:hypothetical protein IV454_07455 [Massilia antarctica]|uniref:Lipoprotein n=1 Tax=Massilia antarctica TaxID=2765360 RepID=A0AA49AA05_9BURK|nr:hypothetical protein [Massilia antarctica]QPI51347.1 hypothetical protein IV454_07455 [Massilia antarctica]